MVEELIVLSAQLDVFIALSSESRKDDDIAACIKQHAPKFHLIFLHADGKGQLDRTLQERIDPIAEAARDELDEHRCRLVGVVPRHETEAWALADGEAIRTSFGTSLPDNALGLPAVTAIEGLNDPKSTLEGAWREVLGSRRYRTRRRELPRERLGELVALDRLRQLTAFRTFEERTRQALAESAPFACSTNPG